MEHLTPRENEILGLMTQGLSNKEISHILTISEFTVKTHVQNILGKLNIKNRKQLIYKASLKDRQVITPDGRCEVLNSEV